MGGKKFRDRLLRPETEFPDHQPRAAAHALPKRHGFTRIIPGLRHQSQSDVVGFRFLFPIEGQRHIDPIGPQQALDRPGIGLPGCRRTQCAQLCNLIQDTPAHPLHSVTLQGMRDLMTHHRRQSGIVLRMFENPGEDGDLPAWKREGIDHLVVLNHRELPLILRLVGGCSDFQTHAMH